MDALDVAERPCIAGSTRIATSWTEALRREAVRERRSFVEQRTGTAAATACTSTRLTCFDGS